MIRLCISDSKETSVIMDKFKQCAYTLLLLFTCFIASPFIFVKIWKTSAASQKPAVSAPPVVTTADSGAQATTLPDGQAAPSDDTQTTAVTGDSTAAEGSQQQAETTTAAPQPDIFVESDYSYFDDALFIGDSRTVGIMEYGEFKNSDFFCSEGLHRR